MAKVLKKTMYLKHLHLVSNFLHLLVLLFLRKFRLFHCGTKLGFDDPTIIGERYTNHEYFPSSESMCFQNELVQSLLYLLHPFEALVKHQQVFAF
ncbi:hypothetical protein D3C79_1020750 [compost metagenome]